MTSFQGVLEKIEGEIERIERELREMKGVRERVMGLKTINRKKFKEINESKYYLKRNIN